MQVHGTASYREIHKELEIGAPTVLPWEFISDTDVESRFMMLAVILGWTLVSFTEADK